MSLQVWSRFQATKSDGTLVKLRIQDFPENRHDEAVGFLLKYFIPEELFYKTAGVPQNPKAMEESRRLLNDSFKDPSFHAMICCVDHGDGKIGQIVGVSHVQLIVAGSEQFPDVKLETEENRKVISLVATVYQMYDPIKELNITCYYDGRGFSVHPGFRNLGIGAEFLKARNLACLAHDVPATGALMTSVYSEKAAEKHNWKTVREINLDDLSRQHGVTFDGSAVMKVMIWKKP